MISVAEADRLLGQITMNARVAQVAAAQAVGRILAEPIAADRALPAASVVRMDGIALRAEFAEHALTIVGAVGAGEVPPALPKGNVCLEIMTGAILPSGADCVVPVENISRAGDTVQITEPCAVGDCIHPGGADYSAGDRLLSPGQQLRSSQFAVLASTGVTQVSVAAPRIAVLASGNELVALEATPALHQLRQSNGSAIQALAWSHGFPNVSVEVVPDDQTIMRQCIETALQTADLVVLSGGVSKGKYDYVPEVLAELSVERLFHGVLQRPGKPMWAGWHSQNSAAVLGLPGNPVSAVTAFRRYGIPLLDSAFQRQSRQLPVALAEAAEFVSALTCFLPVRLSPQGAVQVRLSNSGDWAGFGAADGFVQLPAVETTFAAGRAVDYYGL